MSQYKETWKGLASEETLSSLVSLTASVPTLVNTFVVRPANTTNYDAGDAISRYTASVKQKETITFSGTSGTANVVGAGGLIKLVTFSTDLSQTAINFESAHVAAYAAVGITLTRDLADIVLEATVAGVPFTAPTVVNVSGNLAGTVAHTTANVTLESILVSGAAATTGGGGTIESIMCETDAIQFAGKTITLWIYNQEPGGIAGDGAPFTNVVTNSNKRTAGGTLQITFGTALAGSTSVFGKVVPNISYQCYQSKNLHMLLSTEAVTAPKSGAVIEFYFTLKNLR